jgi:hypothetical protein
VLLDLTAMKRDQPRPIATQRDEALCDNPDFDVVTVRVDLWGVTPRSPVQSHRRFGWGVLHMQGR